MGLRESARHIQLGLHAGYVRFYLRMLLKCATPLRLLDVRGDQHCRGGTGALHSLGFRERRA